MYIKRLKELREHCDKKQEDIANILNCKQQAYSNYEIGKRALPYEMLICLADYYETSADYILGITDIKKPYPKKQNKRSSKK